MTIEIKGNSTPGTLREKEGTIWKALYFAYEQDMPMAIWRLPGSRELQCDIDVSGSSTVSHIDLESLPTGFLFCPYEDGDNLLIRSDIHLSSMSSLQYSERVKIVLRDDFQAFLNDEDKIESRINYHFEPTPQANGITREDFENVVIKALVQIKEGYFEKVVPSRTKSVRLPDSFNVEIYFEQLCEVYPEAFVYFSTIPGHGSWLGATPELLLDVEQQKLFRTVSLAGTQPSHSDIAPEDVAWKQKDIEEQALVSRYIINCFKQIRLREFEEHGPKTVVAGNLMHLKTSYSVDMETTGFHNLGSTMLGLLHPTAAVCGMPQDAARSFLNENEAHERRYYAGYLGPVNHLNDTHLYVNLRCMELFGEHATLYAGGGVTEDSIPSKEWEETELKFNTLLNVLGISFVVQPLHPIR